MLQCPVAGDATAYQRYSMNVDLSQRCATVNRCQCLSVIPASSNFYLHKSFTFSAAELTLRTFGLLPYFPIYWFCYSFIYLIIFGKVVCLCCLQCFDTVGWLVGSFDL